MKTPLHAAFFAPAIGKFYLLALCLLTGYFCPAQSNATITTVFYINVPQEYNNCYSGNARLLVEGIDSKNNGYWQAYAYTPGQEITLIMQGVGEFRVTLIGLSCPMANTTDNSDGGEEINIRPSARLRCYGGRINVTLR